MKPFTWVLIVLVSVAMTAVSYAQSPATGATFISSNKVAAAFASGMPLLESSKGIH